MTDWVRLWHDMPTDPKWRVVARKSGQPLACVIALFSLMLTNASGNSAERGTLLAWDHEDAAAALDMDTEAVAAIFEAMQGKVLDGLRLTGWERRQPKREDDSSKRVAKHRAEKKRDVTHGNAPETDTEQEEEKPPLAPPAGGRRGKHPLPLDWAVPAASELPPKAKACAEQWTAASYETHGEAFVNYWRGNGKMMVDWRGTWANRVIALHSQVMRDQRFGNAPTGAATAAKPMTDSEWNEMCERGAAIARAQGRSREAVDWEAKRRTGDPPRRTASGPPASIGALASNLVKQVPQSPPQGNAING